MVHNAGSCSMLYAVLRPALRHAGINIGPEPTTDRFVVVESGLEERRTPGNTLVVQPSKPYQVTITDQ